MKYPATPRIMTRRNRPAIQSDRGRLSYVTGWPIFVQSTLDERLAGLKLEAGRFFASLPAAGGFFDTLSEADFMSLSPRSCWEAILSSPSGLRSSRSEEHTSELQSRGHLVCRLLLEKKNVLL